MAESDVATAPCRSAGTRTLLTAMILAMACLTGIASRLFAIIRFESIIHEFDPWFNYRSTVYMVEHGFYKFLNWFDATAWYPLGRNVGGTVFPGLMLTSSLIHSVLHALHIPVHIREICVFMGPAFSGLTAISTYFLTKELWNSGAGLFAACMIVIAPGYTSRSVAGSYDNEAVAIFALQFTYFLWVKSMKTGSMMWASFTALSYFYMVSAWGGYVFIINLIPLHVLVLLIMGRYSSRLFVSYTTFYCLATICSMQIPYVSYQPVKTSEHMGAFGVFGILQIVAAMHYLRPRLTKQQFKDLLITGTASISLLAVAVYSGLVWAGIVTPFIGRFYSLFDTGYAKIHLPLIASVSEHQPTTWVSFFFDMHVAVVAFPFGLYQCFNYLNDARVFIIIYAISAVYFAGVMIRLILTLTPAVCVLSGIAFSSLYTKYFSNAPPVLHDTEESDESPRNRAARRPRAAPSVAVEDEDNSTTRLLVVGVLTILLAMYAVHCTFVTSVAYSSPSVVIQSSNSRGDRVIIDDLREAYHWLRENTREDARVMAWWDYGYQLAGMANRTTIVDNNTWNNSHIAVVGKAMASNETAAYEILRAHDVDYVLVIFGGVLGYSGDDINKFLWMVRIAEGEYPKEIRETEFFTEKSDYSVGSDAPETFTNSLMYKLSYYRFGEVKNANEPAGYDRVRDTAIGKKDITLEHMEEAFTTEHWMVRIYRVKEPANRPIFVKETAKTTIPMENE